MCLWRDDNDIVECDVEHVRVWWDLVAFSDGDVVVLAVVHALPVGIAEQEFTGSNQVDGHHAVGRALLTLGRF
jgi:hypothetical protein